MSFESLRAVAFVLFAAALFAGCQPAGEAGPSAAGSGTNTANAAVSEAPAEKGMVPSGTGVEKEKPAPGTGNVQGKALYNEKPAEGVEVKLCETFSQFMSGCGGKTYVAQTDAQGEYLIKNVPPGVYEGLIVKVFDTDYFVFATSGVVSSAKYRIEDGKTFFAPDTNLFKNDLKVSAPKAGSKVPGEGIEVAWAPYPDAAYYKVSIHPDSGAGAETNYDYINKRVDGTTFPLDKPLTGGKYRVAVQAFNANDKKLSESPNDMEFTVTGGAEK